MEKNIEAELAELREENKLLREAAQRPAKHNEEDARVSWLLAMQLLKQAQAENEECAYWFVSALSKLASSHPHRPVIEVLGLARRAMPTAAKQYADYVADKS
ncbi:MAG: hypothetical protein WC208_09710 [Gallionella sp.]